MSRRIRKQEPEVPTVDVSSLQEGTLVEWNGNTYVVACRAIRGSGFAAVNLETGSFISRDTRVVVLPSGSQVVLEQKLSS